MFGTEEESDDIGPIPMKRTNAPIPEPEIDHDSSMLSVSSTFSKNSRSKEEKMEEKTKNLQLTFPQKKTKLKGTVSAENLQAALNSNDINEILKQATLMVTGLSYQFVNIKKQIDENEAKISQLEENFKNQRKR